MDPRGVESLSPIYVVVASNKNLIDRTQKRPLVTMNLHLLIDAYACLFSMLLTPYDMVNVLKCFIDHV